MSLTEQFTHTKVVEILNAAIDASGGPWSDSLARVKNLVDARHPGFPWEERWFCQIEGARAALRILQEHSCLAVGSLDRPATLPLAAATAVDSDQHTPSLTLLQRLAALDWLTADRMERSLRLYPKLLAACGGDDRSAERVLAVLTAGINCDSVTAAA